mmetsp:Transcript_21897/g.32784  ORF Transcript_21897/g.32784 Transcript_21897/m.32784 type:complete len:133 (+) Transcript_21897:83-481(+)|eukprot:CAMPEP_0203672564 /NCGR_PEP_ID=MMETSP0090-20130426/8590_1 /ASSEMBLY_ACC=CAM_ASM_001088 /TAXON_ID=426623 /ORGANISM="Chaetoceros affinis, Strain CCMP159" /LENGTH=132 /DNA_ID=CAMNT_0050537897 /DNA_START=41 /DNA_END=439 /DNA_ORIENTATION=-
MTLTSTSSSTSNVPEIEETLARIRSHKGVESVLIMTKEGAIIQSSLSKEQSTTHAALLSQLTAKACNVIQMLDGVNSGGNDNGNNNDNDNGGGGDELTFLRLRSHNKEIMIAPDKEFLMVVIQNPNSTADGE